jgi:myo-inositol-1(or 4)-monophosphatase
VVALPDRPTATHARHRELLATAVAAAIRGAEVIKRKSAALSALTWTAKSPTDFVSEVDLAAEAIIREVILARHPSAVIVGEELSPGTAASNAVTFVVDPLDGTTNFLHGYPAYAVSIAVLLEGELCAGAILHGVTGDLFTATLGGGARLAGQPITVSRIAEPTRALIGTGFPFKHPDLVEPYMGQLARILRATAGVRRAGSAALDLADVACGRFDAFWELHLAPWDVAAGILLVREAGGVVTDTQGRPATVGHGPIVAGNPEMHPWLLGTLQNASA